MDSLRPLVARYLERHPNVTLDVSVDDRFIVAARRFVVATESVDASGKVLFRGQSSIFVRGEGGFGGDRGPSGARNVPPDRKPDKSISYPTLPQQALIYRLSGDMNPLHADPDFAKMGGFDVPILHGLCTFGHAGRAVLAAFCGNDPKNKSPFILFENRPVLTMELDKAVKFGPFTTA